MPIAVWEFLGLHLRFVGGGCGVTRVGEPDVTHDVFEPLTCSIVSSLQSEDITHVLPGDGTVNYVMYFNLIRSQTTVPH